VANLVPLTRLAPGSYRLGTSELRAERGPEGWIVVRPRIQFWQYTPEDEEAVEWIENAGIENVSFPTLRELRAAVSEVAEALPLPALPRLAVRFTQQPDGSFHDDSGEYVLARTGNRGIGSPWYLEGPTTRRNVAGMKEARRWISRERQSYERRAARMMERINDDF
jgi:hypothetical protein